MLISEVIQNVKNYCKGTYHGLPIDDNTTRDKILYGNPNQECKGIVTTIYASVDVIKKAHELNANFIIVHEALFYNHGDHQDWLKDSNNKTYLDKSKLLDEYNICVWRCHDYIHSGIKYKDGYIDGIFYGLAKELEWDDAIIGSGEGNYLYLECKESCAREIGQELINKMHLNGLKCIGNLDAKVTKIYVCGHIMENSKANPIIEKIDKEDINLILPLELIDFTLTEYIKDSAQLGYNRCILAPGHFNIEEPGMKYMEKWLPEAINEDIKITYVQAGDMYKFL